MQTRARRLLVLLLLAACHPARPLEPGVAAQESVLPLGSRSWRPGAEVPLWSEPRLPGIPFGELGRTPRTRLYLTFETDLARELSLQGVRWPEDREPPARVAGRFGSGLSLEDADGLEIDVPGSALPRRDATGQAWTLEFWVRPESLGLCSVLTLRGLMRLTCEPDGHLLLSTPGGPDAEGVPRATVVRSDAALEPGRWSHVAIVLDSLDTNGLRLVVDGEANALKLRGPVAVPESTAVQLSTGGPRRALAAVIDELRVQERAANTEEFQAALAAPRPLERLRLSRPSTGASEIEVWFGVQRAPRIDTPEAFRTAELERVVVDGRGLLRVDGHWRRIDACDPPVARTTQASAFLGDHRILVFGGETRDSHHSPMRNTDDTWIFDTRAETWERLELELAPPPRCHQAAAFSPEHGLAVLAGGFVMEGRELDAFGDTWLFHRDSLRWELCASADLGYGFSDDAVVYHPRRKRFVFVSGVEVRTFDPVDRTWQHLQPIAVVDEAGRPVPGRPQRPMIGGYAPTTNQIVLFGGCRDPQDDSSFVDDVHLLDVGAKRMTRLAPPAAGERPSPRVRSGFGWDSKRERFVLFGGVRSQRSERMDDLWSFDPVTRLWKRHEACGTPTARGGYFGMEYDPGLDRFFLLCGRHSHQRFLAESWTLSLDERAPGHARYAFDRRAFPGETDWFTEQETPGDSRVDVRFRESADAFTWTEWSTELPTAQRYVEVELTLAPGSKGEAPRVAAMGFRAPH